MNCRASLCLIKEAAAMRFDGLCNAPYGALLVDPPWRFRTWDKREAVEARTTKTTHYRTMRIEEIRALPIADIAARDCALFLWITWPNLLDALSVIEAWGFKYKTCAFGWFKTTKDGSRPAMGQGFWTRANSEPCLLATRGKPKRLHADVPQAIIEPRREHSRKPDCVHERIERLVAGPYCELFATARRPGWDCIGDQLDKYLEAAE
jgi:N6-adenosine-specific RNA methylase IME4